MRASLLMFRKWFSLLPLLIVTHQANSVFVLAEDPLDREKINTIADALEANIVFPTAGVVRTQRTHLEAGESTELMDEFICDGEFLLDRSGEFSGDGRDVSWTRVRMVNPRYFAVLGRARPSDDWEMQAFSEKGEALYDKFMKEPWGSSHPSSSYLRVPPYRAHFYLREAEILGRSRPEKVDGTESETWDLRYTPPGLDGKHPDRQFVITSRPPYRLLEHRYEIDGKIYQSDVTHFSNWVSVDGAEYPTERKSTFRNRRNGPPIVFVGETSFTESMDGFNEEEAFLSFYGLPEPGDEGMSRLMMGAVLGAALLVLVATYVYRKRRA